MITLFSNHILETGWEPPEAHRSSRQSITALVVSYMPYVFFTMSKTWQALSDVVAHHYTLLPSPKFDEFT